MRLGVLFFSAGQGLQGIVANFAQSCALMALGTTGTGLCLSWYQPFLATYAAAKFPARLSQAQALPTIGMQLGRTVSWTVLSAVVGGQAEYWRLRAAFFSCGGLVALAGFVLSGVAAV